MTIDETELRALVARAQAGEVKARDCVVAAMMPLLQAEAKRFRKPNAEADLIQAGICGVEISKAQYVRGIPADQARTQPGGLLLAIERFDPGRGVKFATFAAWWIRHAMQCELSHHGPAITMSRRQRETRRKIRRAAAKLEAINGERPSTEEVLEALPAAQKHCKRRRVEESLKPEMRTARKARPAGNEDLGAASDSAMLNPEDLDSRVPSPDEAFEVSRLIERLGAVINDSLTPQELEIVKAHYGMSDSYERGEDESLAAIAVRLGVPKSTLKQVHKRALAKLRVMLESPEAKAVVASAIAVLGWGWATRP